MDTVYERHVDKLEHLKELQYTSGTYGTGAAVIEYLAKKNLLHTLSISVVCSVVWSQDRIIMEGPLERNLHNSTRAQLATPYDNRHVDYIPFDQRMNLLRLLTFRERRIISSILTIIKIMRSDLRTTLSSTIEEYRHVVLRIKRKANIFDFRRHCDPHHH